MKGNIFRNVEDASQYPQIFPQPQSNNQTANAFNSFSLEQAKQINNQMLRNARNLEELVGIKVLQADGLLAQQQQNGNINTNATTPNQNSVYDPRFDPIHFSQKVPCMGNRQFLINQAILSSSKPSQKVHLGGKSRDPKRVVTASTDGTMATRFPEFPANKLQSVGSTNSFKQFQESCGQNPLSKKAQSQTYALMSRNQNSQIPTAFLENIGQESNQENDKFNQNMQSDEQSQIKDNETAKDEKQYTKEADPIKALKTIFQQKNKKKRVPLDVNQIANKYKKKMLEQQSNEKQQLHSRGLTTASDPHQLGSYFESYMQGKVFTPQSHYIQPTKVFKEDQLQEDNKEQQNFDQNIYIQQNTQSAQYQQKPFSPEINDYIQQQLQDGSKLYSQQSKRPSFQNNVIQNQQIQNLDIKQRLENLRQLFEEDDINNAVQEIQNEWLLEEQKAQYNLENNAFQIQDQKNDTGKNFNILAQKKGQKHKKSPVGIPAEDQDFPINDLRRYLTDKIKNVQKRSQPNDIITNNNRVPLELPKELQKSFKDDNQDQQPGLKFQFKASTLTHISEIRQIGQEKIENQFIERIFREQTGYQFEQYQLKQQKEQSKQIIQEKRRNHNKFLSHQQKDSWKSKNNLQNIDEQQKKHQIFANMQSDLYVIEKQQTSEDTRQSQKPRQKKQKQNVIQEQMMRIDRINRGISDPQKTNTEAHNSKYLPQNTKIYELAAGSSFTQQIHNDGGTGSIQTNYTQSDNQGGIQMFQHYHDSGTGFIIQPGVDSRPTPMTQILRHNTNNDEEQSYAQTSNQSPINRQQDQKFQTKTQSNEKQSKNEEKIGLNKDNVLIIHPQNYQFQQQIQSPGKTLVTSQQKISLTKSLLDEQLASGPGTFDNQNQVKNNSQKFLHTQQILMNLPQNNIFFGSKQNGVNDFRVSQIVQEYNNKQKMKEVQQFDNEDEDQGFPNYLSDTELFMRTRNQFIKREKAAESRGGGYRQKQKKRDRSQSPVNDQFKLLYNQKQMFFKQRLEEIYNARINQNYQGNNKDIQFGQLNQQQEIVHGSHFQYFCPKRFNRYPRFTIFFKKDQIQGKDKQSQYNIQNTVSLSPQFLSYLMDKSASGINSNPTEAITSSLKQNQILQNQQQAQKSPKQNASVEEKELKQRSTLSSDVSPIRYGVHDNNEQHQNNQNKIFVGGDDAIQSWNLYNDNMQSYDPFQKVILVKGIDNSILTSFRTLKRENNTVSDTFKIVHKKFQPNKNKALMRMMKGQNKFGGVINFNNNKYQIPEYPFTDNEYAMEIGQAQLIAESFLQQPEDSILNAPKEGIVQIQQKQFSQSNVSKSPIYHDIHGNQIESEHSVIQQISGYEKQKNGNMNAKMQQQTLIESKIIHGGITGISQQSSIGLGVSNIPAAYEISQFDQKNTQNIQEVVSKISPKPQELQDQKKGYNKKKIQENIFINHKQQSPLRQSADNEFKVSQRTNTGMLRGAIYSQNTHLIQLKNAIDFQNIDQLNQNDANNKKFTSQNRRDYQNNKHQIEVMVLSKVDPFEFAFPAQQPGVVDSALTNQHQNFNIVNQNGQKYIQIQSPQLSFKHSQIGKRNPFNNLVKSGTTSQAVNQNKNNKKQEVETFNSNNDYFKHINKQKLIDEQRVQTVNKAEQEQKSFRNDQNSILEKQRLTQELLENADIKHENNDIQKDEKIKQIQVEKTNQNQKVKEIQRHQTIYKLSSFKDDTSANKDLDKNLQVFIEQNRPKSKGRIQQTFKQHKISSGIDQQKFQQKYGKDFKIPQLPDLLQNQLFLNDQQPLKQNQGQAQNQQYKIKKFIDEIYQKEAKNRYHKQYVREDYLSPHCPIFNLEKFHQLKPKDELANMGLKNKFGVINQQAFDDGIIKLDNNGQPTIYHPSQSLSNVLGFQAGGPNLKPSNIIRMNEQQQKQFLLNQQSGLPALFGSQISYRQNNQNQSASDNNVSNQILINNNQRQSLHLQNQISGETIGGQASVKDQNKVKQIGNKQLKIPQSNYITNGQQSQNQIQQTDDNPNLKATFDGRVEITSDIDQNEIVLRQSGQLYESYVNPKISTNKIQTGEHDIENIIYQGQSNQILSQN